MVICLDGRIHVVSAIFAGLIASFAAQISNTCDDICRNWFGMSEIESAVTFLKTFLLRRIPTSLLLTLASEASLPHKQSTNQGCHEEEAREILQVSLWLGEVNASRANDSAGRSNPFRSGHRRLNHEGRIDFDNLIKFSSWWIGREYCVNH